MRILGYVLFAERFGGSYFIDVYKVNFFGSEPPLSSKIWWQIQDLSYKNLEFWNLIFKRTHGSTQCKFFVPQGFGRRNSGDKLVGAHILEKKNTF